MSLINNIACALYFLRVLLLPDNDWLRDFACGLIFVALFAFAMSCESHIVNVGFKIPEIRVIACG